MIVMRLSNPEDQNYITRIVSEQFSSLVRMLPILHRGEAFMLGEAVVMPVRTRVELPPKIPKSSDVDVFAHWAEGLADMNVENIIRRWWKQDRSHPDTEKIGQQTAWEEENSEEIDFVTNDIINEEYKPPVKFPAPGAGLWPESS
jgi:hypothetical protein